MTSAIVWQAWARERIDQCYDRFTAQLGRTILDPGVDEIHELRISIRRLRQSLYLCQRRPRKTLRRGLRQLMHIAGQLRDCDIAARHFEHAKLSEFEDAARRKRRRAEKNLVRFLSKRAHQLKVWREEELKISLTSATEKIKLLAGKFYDCGEKASQPGSGIAQLHQARIAAKKLRYTLELFHPAAGPGEVNPLEEFLKLQKLLGQIHDISTVLDLIPDRKISRRLKHKQSRKILEFQVFWVNEMRANQDAMIRQCLELVRLPLPLLVD